MRNPSDQFVSFGASKEAPKPATPLPLGEKVARCALVAVLTLAAWNWATEKPARSGPEPLDRFEQDAARHLSRSMNMSLHDAEIRVLAQRPSAGELARRAGERRRRAEEEEALQRAFP